MTTTFIPTVLPGDPAPVVTPPAAIQTGGWFPPIDPALFRDEQRVDANAITDARVRQALIAAIIRVGRDLEEWRLGQVTAGFATLDQVPALWIDDQSELAILYRRAVFTAAKAEIVERFVDVDLTGRGEREASQLDPTVAELRRDSVHAVREILGVGRMTVDLI
ncbi:head completion/stabilization protein [uncultured Sphingomonas sp.]|uniref:head completion/stabilization protein n=1 Tax=uncultured Sphingomonas sp. TaxID=158754 RepID=UPI0025FC2DC0|nr:head completion/stabilization protein [uncultured Sphingomonas sp.]